MMIRHWTPTLAVACLTACYFAQTALALDADADGDSPEQQQAESETDASQPRVNVIVSGARIGPDGETHVFGAEGAVDGLAELPEELQKRVQQLMKGVHWSTGGIVLGGHAAGKITIIGPDGKTTEAKFGDGEPVDVEAMRKKVLENLPADVSDEVRAAIESAVAKAAESAPKIQGVAGKVIFVGPDGNQHVFSVPPGNDAGVKALTWLQRQKSGESRNNSVDNESISEKLDLILERLEKLEARVDELSNEKE